MCSDQIANGPKVVPLQVVHENGLDFQVQLKLKRRQVPQFYEAILRNFT